MRVVRTDRERRAIAGAHVTVSAHGAEQKPEIRRPGHFETPDWFPLAIRVLPTEGCEAAVGTGVC